MCLLTSYIVHKITYVILPCENSGTKAPILSYTRDNILQLQNHYLPIKRSGRKLLL